MLSEIEEQGSEWAEVEEAAAAAARQSLTLVTPSLSTPSRQASCRPEAFRFRVCAHAVPTQRRGH
eukprot:1393055-Rhodomonas_salina.2